MVGNVNQKVKFYSMDVTRNENPNCKEKKTDCRGAL